MLRVAALAFVLLLPAQPAAARSDPEWTACDFGIDPRAGLLGTKRWLENGKELGNFEAVYGGRNPYLGTSPTAQTPGMAACEKALASPDLTPDQWPRRVSLLLAKAAHRLAADDPSGALGDIDAAVAAIATDASPIEVSRSIGVVADMLRGLAFEQRGEPAKAVQAIASAAAARPWSGRIQNIAATLLERLPESATAQAVVMDRLVRLDSKNAEVLARRVQLAPASAAAVGKVEPRRLYAVMPRYEGAGGTSVSSSDDVMRKFLVGGSLGQKQQVRNSYSSRVAFFKEAGFKDKPMTDGRGVTIEFTGDTSTPTSVEEMTLLRAAELAAAAGKPAMIILDKRDYSRTSQMTINGSPSGAPVQAGYVTQLDVAFVDPAAPAGPVPVQNDRLISVRAVLDALTPIYNPVQSK